MPGILFKTLFSNDTTEYSIVNNDDEKQTSKQFIYCIKLNTQMCHNFHRQSNHNTKWIMKANKNAIKWEERVGEWLWSVAAIVTEIGFTALVYDSIARDRQSEPCSPDRDCP